MCVCCSDTEVSRTENLDNVRHLEQRQAELHAEATQLKDSQRALIEQLKKCCKNDVALKLLVRAGVQEQLAAVSRRPRLLLHYVLCYNAIIIIALI